MKDVTLPPVPPLLPPTCTAEHEHLVSRNYNCKDCNRETAPEFDAVRKFHNLVNIFTMLNSSHFSINI
jgi:hypothetical protein